jgi:hypothetical protein
MQVTVQLPDDLAQHANPARAALAYLKGITTSV